MRRFKWRAFTMAWVLVLAALPVTYSTTQAIGSYSLTWTGSYWKDANCGQAGERFEVRLFKDADYQGTQWRLCSDIPNFCYLPYGSGSSDALLCINGFDGATANDYPSSIKVISIEGGSTCRVQLRDDASYAGAAWTQWDPMNDANLGPVWPNDVWSSIRRLC